MAKLTPEQEQFLKDYNTAINQKHAQLSANWIREEMQAGNLKMEDLTPEQKQLLTDYPEDQTE